MNKKQLVVVLAILFLWATIASAYIENYPPYKFKDGAPKYLQASPLKNLTESGSKYIADKNNDPKLLEVYRADLDRNGLDDFIVFSSGGGVGLASAIVIVDILLQTKKDYYQKISYDTMANDPIKELVDLNQDGRYEVIITGLYHGDKHNYFTYNIYEFRDYRLINADAKFPGFPKFVWITDKPNDKDTTHLTKEEKIKHIKEKDASIHSQQVSNTIKPLGEKEVKSFLKQLNSQGIVATFDKNMKKDKYRGWIKESSSFSLEPGAVAYFLYRADINNDGKDEHVLCTQQGSGGFFDIDAIYQEKSGKLTDIFNEIKIPLRKLIRDVEKESYDLEEGYSGFMNGRIKIEKDNGKAYFTLEQTTRKYEGKGFKEDFNPTQRYKFLWDKNGIQLVQYYIGDKIYKQ